MKCYNHTNGEASGVRSHCVKTNIKKHKSMLRVMAVLAVIMTAACSYLSIIYVRDGLYIWEVGACAILSLLMIIGIGIFSREYKSSSEK